MLAIFTCGCQRRAYTDLYVENMAGEIRELEDRVYEYDAAYRQAEDELDILRSENLSLRERVDQRAVTAGDAIGPFKNRLEQYRSEQLLTPSQIIIENEKDSMPDGYVAPLPKKRGFPTPADPSTKSPMAVPKQADSPSPLSPKSPVEGDFRVPRDKGDIGNAKTLDKSEFKVPRDFLPNNDSSFPKPNEAISPQPSKGSTKPPSKQILPSNAIPQTRTKGNNGKIPMDELEPPQIELGVPVTDPQFIKTPSAKGSLGGQVEEDIPAIRNEPPHKLLTLPPSPSQSKNGRARTNLELEESQIIVPNWRREADVVQASHVDKNSNEDHSDKTSIAKPQWVEPSDHRIVEIAFHPVLCRAAYRVDGKGENGIRLVLQPKNEAGEFVPSDAKMTIVVVDPESDQPDKRIARWKIDNEQLNSSLEPIGTEQGYHLALDWQSTVPKGKRVTLHVRYEMSDGKKLVNEREMDVHIPSFASDAWTPRVKR